MREIKFRAFGEDGKMHYNILPNGRAYMKLLKPTGTDCAEFELFDARDIMQYTGLQDKNGKEIYEGDILRHDNGDTSKVWFSNGSFTHGVSGLPFGGIAKYFEVIGNIYENPELLK